MCEEKIIELKNICKPIIDYMKKNCSPHDTLIITDEQFKIVSDTISCYIYILHHYGNELLIYRLCTQ